MPPDTASTDTQTTITLSHAELVALWDKHTECEFHPEKRSVDDTMATMTDDCYVNHVPTMAGGYGQKLLSQFYGTDFIPVTPPDWEMKPLSRIVSVSEQSIVDEMVITFTHTQPIPWLLPGIPATNKKISIALMAVVRFKNGKIHHEHIYWDQGTVLKQAGLIGDTVTVNGKQYPAPVKGAEAAQTVERDSARLHGGSA
ncbi:hypothetical protein M427DRAFT_58010 [Gonapodya prolifera JEL478]|uniref:NTF2-like protein n=1 Tax=Gonapodya prolifera (strain JEL478) TaxID=1344416 RepID=A0A139ABN5_GONPJ|nr:hypothetical protein M427DRAFT_58010 [Gonapodya prolifera JEL478]|eukprot:KXS14014.1 hypothetical protein M427DRAFT_58010 [Gonapodya prolifera JEL478]